MYSFDSLTLKFFVQENENFLRGASLQKIQQPSRRELVFSLRNKNHSSRCEGGESRKFYINIDPKYPHLCFIDDYSRRGIKIPQHPPMFCMQLRKYLDGARILDVKHVEYERILELYFNYSDEIGSLAPLCLSIELMGKHSNVILYNASSKVILGCMHNISPEKSSVREVFGGVTYIYPPKQYKTDILKTSYGSFCEVLKGADDPTKAINDHYYYLSRPLIEQCANSFECLQKLVSGDDKTPLYNLLGGTSDINSLIDKHFEDEMFRDIFARKSAQLKKQINKELKRLEGVVKSHGEDTKAAQYKQKGDLILQNIHQIAPESAFFEINGTKIDLDTGLTLPQNAQRYYGLYRKALNAQSVRSEMFSKAQDDIKYYQAMLFDVMNSKTLEELDEITISENDTGKKTEKPVVQKIVRGEWEIFIGKNNKQNDYLISKIARGEDLWFHAKGFPSAHVILKPIGSEKTPPDELLLHACQIVKENSPLKNDLKASIIYTKRKFLRKPQGAKLGHVTYREEREIVV